VSPTRPAVMFSETPSAIETASIKGMSSLAYTTAVSGESNAYLENTQKSVPKYIYDIKFSIDSTFENVHDTALSPSHRDAHAPTFE